MTARRDARRGPVAEAGVWLGPAQIGALAAAGIAKAVCSCAARAAVLATGSELRRPASASQRDRSTSRTAR